ncbi:MAG: hypothetical protein EB127_13680 [Alphaproteobacteria bacterium]|nr:hypothetical protein [Alphaproteobacteria bacterium]
MSTKLNKIGIIGTQCVGKSTLIEDMLLQWPQLTRPTKTYRDLVKEKNLPINKNGTKESQQAILDFLCDEAMTNYGKKKMIFDRTPLDNLVYSLWLYDKQVTDIDEAFIDKSVQIVRQAMKFYSVLFYIPLCAENDVMLTSKPQRDVDPVYRGEIGVLFEALYKAWMQGGSRFFDKDETPPIIPLYGNPLERISMLRLYMTDKCEFYGEKDSLIADDIKQQNFLSEQLGLGSKGLHKK